MSQSNQFRIGGLYRNGDGIVCRIVREDEGMLKAEMAIDGYEFAFHFHPVTGKYMTSSDRAASEESLHLLPGEVDEQGNPIEEKPAKIGDIERLRKAVRKTLVVGTSECELEYDACLGALVGSFVIGDKKKTDDPNAGMIARDLTGFENKLFRKTILRVGKVVHQGELKSTAKPALASLTSSPDLAGEWKPFEFGSAHLSKT